VGLCHLIRQREAFGVLADILRCPDGDPDCQREQHGKSVQKVEVTFVMSKVTIVAREKAEEYEQRNLDGQIGKPDLPLGVFDNTEERSNDESDH
jgi:hypothetical protein